MRFVATSDLHLNYSQYGFKQRERDFEKAVEYVFAQAIVQKADAIILAGDIFDLAKPTGHSVQFMQFLVEKTKAHGVAILGIDGNHDSADNNWLQVCGIKSIAMGPSAPPGSLMTPLIIDGISICGINATHPAMFYSELKALADANVKCDVLVVHQAIAEIAEYAGAGITAMDMMPYLRPMGVRYVAAGDIHITKDLLLGSTQFMSTGPTEMNDIDEARVKQFAIVDITPTTMKIKLEAINTRPIFEKVLNEPKDFDTLLSDIVKVPDSLVLLQYKPELRELVKKAEELLKAQGNMYISRPAAVVSDALNKVIRQQTFERNSASSRLLAAITAFFEPETEQAQLITQLLNTPDAVDNVVKKYIASKGITQGA